MGLIKTTYEIITPESAEDGAAEDQGWLDEEGQEYSVQEAIQLLKGMEPSSSSFHEGIWYTVFGEADYRDGNTQNDSYHLSSFTVEEQRTIYYAATKGMLGIL